MIKKFEYEHGSKIDHDKLTTLVINDYDIVRYLNVQPSKTMERVENFTLQSKLNKLKYTNLMLVQVLKKPLHLKRHTTTRIKSIKGYTKQ